MFLHRPAGAVAGFRVPRQVPVNASPVAGVNVERPQRVSAVNDKREDQRR